MPRDVALSRFFPVAERRAATREPNELEQRGVQLQNFRVRSSTIARDEDGTVRFTAAIASDRAVEMETYMDGGYVRFMEILDPAGMNLERENCIGMFLDHRTWSSENAVGRWENFRWVNEGGVNLCLADGFISNDDDTATIRTRIENRTIQTFSLGYQVTRYSDETLPEGPRTLRALEYIAIEASITAAPADHFAVTRALVGMISNEGDADMARGRGQGGGQAPSNGNGNGRGRGGSGGGAAGTQRNADLEPENNLDEGGDDQGGEGVNADGDEDDDDLFIEDGEGEGDQGGEGDDQGGERSRDRNDRGRQSRARTLQTAARNAGIPSDFLARYAGRDVGVMTMLSDWQASRSRRSQGGRGVFNADQYTAQTGAAPNSERAAIIANAVRTFKGETVSDGGRPAQTPAEIYRSVCRAHNVRFPDSATDYFEHLRQQRDVAPQVASAFLHVLENVGQEYLIGNTTGEKPLWWEAISRRLNATSYKTMIAQAAAEYSAFELHEEGREVNIGLITKFDTEARVWTLNQRYGVSRVLFEEGGEGFLNSVEGVNAAARTGMRTRVAIRLNTNPLLNDKRYFFEAGAGTVDAPRRNNVGQNMPLTLDNIAVARVAMMNGETDSAPTILVVPPSMWFKANQLVNQAPNGEVNPFADKFTVEEAPGMDPNSWELMYDPAELPAYLDVRKGGVIIEMERQLQFDGFQMLGRVDFEFAFGNPRAIYRAYTGAAPATFLRTGEPTNYGF